MALQKSVSSGMAPVEGTELYYEVAGEGEPLVLLHAGFVDSRMWDPQLAPLAERFRVVRYDRRGCGKSALTGGSFSYRKDLQSLLDFLGIERAHYIGCSVGGETVIDFALEHPERVNSLVLVSSALGGYPLQGEMPPLLKDFMAALQGKQIERAADLAVQIWIDGPKRTAEQVDPALRAFAREMSLTALAGIFAKEESLEPSAYERLKDNQQRRAFPALVVLGALDDDSILQIGELLTERLGAEKFLIPEAAHLPSLEKPDKFLTKVLEFLHG
ncbi:MAG: alpha/beta hydrolase [Armatimonas sp.]